MKDRLIKLVGESTGVVYDGDVIAKEEIDITEDEIERIVDYLLANGVIAPPCKVGDDAWWVDPETKEVQCSKNGIKAICYYGDGNFKVISNGENEPEPLHTIWCMLSEKEANERLAVMIAEGSKQ